MKVKELLAVYEDKHYTDVIIIDGDASSKDLDLGYDDVLCEYNHKDNVHDEWGQLDYFNTYFANPLEKYYKYTVKHFTVVNDITIDGVECIYITI